MTRTRRLLSTLCAMLLLALQAPHGGVSASVYLSATPSTASLQAAQAGEHHAIVKNGQAAAEQGVPHDADNPILPQTAAFSPPCLRVEAERADQVSSSRPDLGFWPCAPPIALS